MRWGEEVPEGCGRVPDIELLFHPTAHRDHSPQDCSGTLAFKIQHAKGVLSSSCTPEVW